MKTGLLLVVLVLSLTLYVLDTFVPQSISCSEENVFTISAWNIQVFGETKWSKEYVRKQIISIVGNYDITFIQEIREKSGESFDSLCNELNDTHSCLISSRAGRTISKEQYGLIYNKNITILETIDYNNDPSNNEKWERPPLKVKFSVNDYIFSAYVIHVKPDDVSTELSSLEDLIKSSSLSTENVICLGDFNADGSYYDEENIDVFEKDHWLIDNSLDTTVAASSNTYDRIIVNSEMYEEYLGYDIYNEISSEVSDHYLVTSKICASEYLS